MKIELLTQCSSLSRMVYQGRRSYQNIGGGGGANLIELRMVVWGRTAALQIRERKLTKI